MRRRTLSSNAETRKFEKLIESVIQNQRLLRGICEVTTARASLRETRQEAAPEKVKETELKVVQ